MIEPDRLAPHERPPLRGLTWSHPRGRDPMHALAAAAAAPGPLAVPGPPVAWDDHPLSGFESRPLDEIAAVYDLIVLDHPGLGDAVAHEALAPLDELLDPAELAALDAATVGQALDSYRYAGHQWALPIDAATQVCATRADAGFAPPATWDDARALAREEALAIPTAAPHTLLTFLGICAAHDPGLEPDAERLVPRAAGEEALDTLRALMHATPPEHRDCDPIQLLDRVAAGSGERPLACAPLLYGYVTYSAQDAGRHRVRFTDAPALARGGVPGSVLGGTGLALSRRSSGDPAALAHLRQAVHPLAQATVVPYANGQPAAAAAWDDPAIDARSLRFYSGTRRSQETAWRRPRHPGWLAFQTEGSDLLLEGVLAARPAGELLDALDGRYRALRGPGSN